MLCLLLTSLSRALLKYVEQHKSQCMPLSNTTDNLPSPWKVATDIIFFAIWLFQSGWFSFGVLFAFSFFTVLPCGMEFKQHCTGLSKHGELQQGTVCGAFRGNRLLMKLMLLSHYEEVPNIFVLWTGLLKNWTRSTEFCGGMWIDVWSILHFPDNVKVEFLQEN